MGSIKLYVLQKIFLKEQVYFAYKTATSSSLDTSNIWMRKVEAMRMLVVSGSYQNYQLIGRGAELVGQRLFNYIDDNAEINKLWGRRTAELSASPEEKSASEEKSADNGADIFLNQV